MIDAIKKVALAGVGAAVLTAEKIEEVLREWVDKGRLSAEEARALAKRLAEQGKVEFESSSREAQQMFKELLEKAGMGQRDRIDALEKRLLALEIEVANLTNHQRAHPPQ
jgi:polyhydroxyalkanoate synthesis regulator phasin